MGTPLDVGVFLLRYKDIARGTSFTRDQADQAMRVVADYLFDQSGGREAITYTVFDWVELDLTAAEWNALGTNAWPTIRPKIEKSLAATDPDLDLGPYAKETLDPHLHILMVIDLPDNTGGTSPGQYTHLAARSFCPYLLVHELGHRYGAPDAFGATSGEENRYEDRWCVMGGLSGSGFWPASFRLPSLTDPDNMGIDLTGPGMCAPTLMAIGWLDPDQHGVSRDLSGSSSVSSASGAVVELSALTGAPGPAGTDHPVLLRYDDLLIEYRLPGPTPTTAAERPRGWDRGLPDPGPDADGWVVVHRTEPPYAPNIAALAAAPGATLSLGVDNVLDIHHPGPLRIGVLTYDAAARMVRLTLSRRAARPLPGTGSIFFGGVEVGAGGWIWTPGGGLEPIPPDSPLLNVLEQVSQIHAMQHLIGVASRDEAGPIVERTTRAIRDLETRVGRLEAVPVRSPLTRALDHVTELHQAAGRLASAPTDEATTREFLDLSDRRLAEIQRIVQDAVDDERRR